MKIGENMMMAMKNLLNNRARSFLTMLGIIIGVGAVIAMVSLGEGAKRQITDRIAAIGSNLLIVTSGRDSSSEITNSIVPLVRESSDYIEELAPAARGSKLAEAGGNSLQTSISGVTPAYARVRNYQVAYGRFLNEEDVSGAARVAVIGSYLAEQLFPGANPIGEELKVAGVRLQVVGVLTSKGQSGFGNADNAMLIPLTTAQERIFGNRNLSEISIQVRSADDIPIVSEQIKKALLEEFDDEDDFSINNMAEILATAQDMTQIMTMLLAGIAAVSLVVGGIGIMNIMLVSVTERIREIGIRKAIGAQPEQILVLFLIEAVTLSLVGGIIGIVTGGALALLVGKIIGWAITISLSAVLVAFTFSVLVGLFFGVYPAYKASGLNPIEALRHD
ncbi:putative ABC transport system permease protein [Hydrogenispora ethanolica]|uniref:Putative ABC transport system permease protein n=1 Tax=Hydrogenispora ethanolica TaxID=1082276 RepID=A0A4R1QWB6_HYDET|nr:ABC transporter permease [Hydrogenispora ethanolica]TCL57703.1 putative ABC transport system permease protein [Hydrogenispora ethanolica]